MLLSVETVKLEGSGRLSSAMLKAVRLNFLTDIRNTVMAALSTQPAQRFAGAKPIWRAGNLLVEAPACSTRIGLQPGTMKMGKSGAAASAAKNIWA